MLNLGVELLVDLRDAGDLRRHALRRMDLGGEAAGVLDRILDGLGQLDDGQGLGPIAAQQLRAVGVRVGDQPIRHRILQDVDEAGLDFGLEPVRGGIPLRIAVDDQHGGRLLPEALRDEGGFLLLLRPRNEPATLDELATTYSGPDIETDDQPQAKHRKEAAVTVVEATDRREEPGRMRFQYWPGPIAARRPGCDESPGRCQRSAEGLCGPGTIGRRGPIVICPARQERDEDRHTEPNDRQDGRRQSPAHRLLPS